MCGGILGHQIHCLVTTPFWLNWSRASSKAVMGHLGKEVAGLGKLRADGWGLGTRMGLESDTIPASCSISRKH